MPSPKKSSQSSAAAAAAGGKNSHPPWVDMIKECIALHPEHARTGVSRPIIKKFVENMYHIQLTPTTASQLNRAIASGAERGVFVLPKGLSGKVKLAPKGLVKTNADAAKENAKPVSKKSKSTPVVKSTTPKKPTSTTAAATRTTTKPKTKTTVTPKPRVTSKKIPAAATKPKETKTKTKVTTVKEPTANVKTTSASGKAKTPAKAPAAKKTTTVKTAKQTTIPAEKKSARSAHKRFALSLKGMTPSERRKALQGRLSNPYRMKLKLPNNHQPAAA